FKSQLEPYRKKRIDVAESMAAPFYWLFNMRQSLSPYKVVWKEIAGRISGKRSIYGFCCFIKRCEWAYEANNSRPQTHVRPT
ncbi:MAG TPA: hypothetical protein VFY68_16440, partial [Nitrososphaeraceae archaeon]|nr:hypothetical protein [Nitrososphaeraceae archaeon]